MGVEVRVVTLLGSPQCNQFDEVSCSELSQDRPTPLNKGAATHVLCVLCTYVLLFEYPIFL